MRTLLAVGLGLLPLTACDTVAREDAGADSFIYMEPDAPGATSFTIEEADGQPTAIAIDPGTSTFYVASGLVGRLYRGDANASGGRLEPFLEMGVLPTSVMAIDAQHRAWMLVAGGPFGDAQIRVVDLTTRTVAFDVSVPAALSHVAIDPVSGDAWATDAVGVTLYRIAQGGTHEVTTLTPTSVDYESGVTTDADVERALPVYAGMDDGAFINLTGIAVLDDGRHALVAHLVDRHVFWVDLTDGTVLRLGADGQNPSGQGLVREGNRVAIAGPDEQRVYVYELADLSTPTPRLRYIERFGPPDVQASANEIALAGDRLLIANAQAAPVIVLPPFDAAGLMIPDGGFPAFDAGPAAEFDLPFRITVLDL